jgi:hypothetical protein
MTCAVYVVNVENRLRICTGMLAAVSAQSFTRAEHVTGALYKKIMCSGQLRLAALYVRY